jgi:hypothetical protein
MTDAKKYCPNGTHKNKKTGKCDSILDDTCTICLDIITVDNIKTKCKHNFHTGCLIGWCKNNKDKPTCPICRGDINSICKKIMPFDSNEIFRYVYVNIGMGLRVIKYYLEQIDNIIYNKQFDINVKMEVWNRSILQVLTHNYFSNIYFKKYIEYLLKQPGIVVSNELVQSLIAMKNAKNTDTLALFKKYKKIPKALKGLI